MLNSCSFIGRLGKDPETRSTNSGKQVTNFSLAVSERRGGEEYTEWVSVICWEKTAEFVGNYMKKGSLAYVQGRMQTRKWKDQNDVDRYTTEIIASNVQNLSPREQSGVNTGEDVPF